MSRKDMSKDYEEKAEAPSIGASKDFREIKPLVEIDKDGNVEIKPSEENVDDLMKEQGVPVEDTVTETGALVFINGERVCTSALKSLQIQYSKNLLVVEINYDEEEQKKWNEPVEKEQIGTSSMTDKTKIISITQSEDKPSVSGVSIPESDVPEVYDLENDDFVKLCAMSSLRANKKKDDISKLKVKASGKHKVEEVELNTAEYDIKEITGMSSALNDLAVQEQKIQKDPNVVKVREVIEPKVVFKGTLFTLTEKFKVYKEKESVDEE